MCLGVYLFDKVLGGCGNHRRRVVLPWCLKHLSFYETPKLPSHRTRPSCPTEGRTHARVSVVVCESPEGQSVCPLKIPFSSFTILHCPLVLRRWRVRGRQCKGRGKRTTWNHPGLCRRGRSGDGRARETSPDPWVLGSVCGRGTGETTTCVTGPVFTRKSGTSESGSIPGLPSPPHPGPYKTRVLPLRPGGLRRGWG